MGQINIIINDEIDVAFRTKIASQGGKRGDLTKAIEEAINLWLKKQK